MALPQEALEDQLRIESAEIMLERGDCQGVACQYCFLCILGLFNSNICNNCHRSKSFRAQVLAAKYLADHKGDEDEQKEVYTEMPTGLPPKIY